MRRGPACWLQLSQLQVRPVLADSRRGANLGLLQARTSRSRLGPGVTHGELLFVLDHWQQLPGVIIQLTRNAPSSSPEGLTRIVSMTCQNVMAADGVGISRIPLPGRRRVIGQCCCSLQATDIR